nr:MAG TPA: hypothetical protein [Crassvirales sp.]
MSIKTTNILYINFTVSSNLYSIFSFVLRSSANCKYISIIPS